MLGFRVWDVEKNSMILDFNGYFDRSYYIALNGRLVFDPGCSYSYLADEEKYIPMQSTGLKDFKGKEIYQGDILKYWGSDGKKLYYHVNDIQQTIRTFYSMCHSAWPENSSNLDMLRKSIKATKTYCEVVGNIYENPGLLEKIK